MKTFQTCMILTKHFLWQEVVKDVKLKGLASLSHIHLLKRFQKLYYQNCKLALGQTACGLIGINWWKRIKIETHEENKNKVQASFRTFVFLFLLVRKHFPGEVQVPGMQAWSSGKRTPAPFCSRNIILAFCPERSLPSCIASVFGWTVPRRGT